MAYRNIVVVGKGENEVKTHWRKAVRRLVMHLKKLRRAKLGLETKESGKALYNTSFYRNLT